MKGRNEARAPNPPNLHPDKLPRLKHPPKTPTRHPLRAYFTRPLNPESIHNLSSETMSRSDHSTRWRSCRVRNDRWWEVGFRVVWSFSVLGLFSWSLALVLALSAAGKFLICRSERFVSFWGVFGVLGELWRKKRTRESDSGALKK
ncbi:hypothetical protein HS088_TW13G00766 [Tripterygium wilfordii]|uniref:Transmembrane protein n=1 Tax=Tripterygium wilfordii TaxID=458696 RepID=A0A7J7CUR4_TRIWF|nr:hypothetical protein HS088_TW13G00766 [Tripterygium wilfordii]